VTERAFGVETVVLDLPPLVGALAERMHAAGLTVPPARAAELAQALVLVRPVSRRRLYWTARAVLVTDPAQVRAFDRVFRDVFGDPRSDEPVELDAARTEPAAADERSPARAPAGTDAQRDVRGASWGSPGSAEGEDERAAVEVPLALASDEERLATRSFDSLDAAELAQLYRLMSRLRLATPLRQTRRFERGRHGQRIDLRRTLRGSLRSCGDPIRLARRHRRVERRRLVMLCDISGSMEPYARAYLQLLTCAVGSGPHAEAFVFATRLTRITRALSSRNPERAIQRAAEAAPDWSSGTRIGDALKAFNDQHGRRGIARGAVVVILSDGWERGDPQLVGREMERLGRLAHRIVWVNPRISAPAFAPRAGGMMAALPHCDALVSGHSLAALDEVAEAVGADVCAPPSYEAVDGEEPEPWASATPVAGSSVAMPSGYGPSRGRTTPGWATEDE